LVWLPDERKEGENKGEGKQVEREAEGYRVKRVAHPD
jgi:hypothetical protein